MPAPRMRSISERSVPYRCTGDIGHPLEEVAPLDPLVELLVRDEPVLAPVLLARPARTSRRRDRERKLRHALQDHALEGALARTRGARYDDDWGFGQGRT